MSMDVQNYFESLGREVDSLKQRVRDLIADAHWQTDGEWKESVVRQVLRRPLPATAVVGRGFVVTGQCATHQLDVLVHDASKPLLFRDGDLVFVTPDAVLGVIEVKSRVTLSLFRESAQKLASDINLIRLHPNTRAFAALFAFDDDGPQGFSSTGTWTRKRNEGCTSAGTPTSFHSWHPGISSTMWLML